MIFLEIWSMAISNL